MTLVTKLLWGFMNLFEFMFLLLRYFDIRSHAFSFRYNKYISL